MIGLLNESTFFARNFIFDFATKIIIYLEVGLDEFFLHFFLNFFSSVLNPEIIHFFLPDPHFVYLLVSFHHIKHLLNEKRR